MSKPFTLVWIQSGGCGGCSMSVLNAESPDFYNSLKHSNIELLWHPSLSEASGAEYLQLLERIESGEITLDALCLEGSVIMGPGGSGRFHYMRTRNQPMFELIGMLAEKARFSIAIGSCAAFGGITMAGVNLAEACGLQYEGKHRGGLLGAQWQSPGGLPVVNIAGCPTHPGWVIETLAQLAAGELDQAQLDRFNRPRSYTNHLVHHGCPRNEYYEYKASAVNPSQQGCLMEHLGCLGTQARADCNTRLWNGSGSCLRGGFACINCTAPGFEEPGYCFTQTPKLAGIPIGLPIDMPKAWFVALSSLSKAATPNRLKLNAKSDHILISPGNKKESDKS